MPKPLAGAYKLLTHQELSGSVEDHRTLRTMVLIFSQGQGQEHKDLVEEPKSLIGRPKEGTGNDPSFQKRTSSVNQTQKSSTTPKGPKKKKKGPNNNEGEGKRKANWKRTYPQGYRILQLEP
ncbi:hypothetical protein O181_122236 [Austropuccinia psidii MF-1]|uniref:Uncharacterized protein n=1 Tax=Austropuccinia psidii MF-1 TaxID=1389203 RepID=A0A9Q3KLW5_9BASI|nr:hypothetical protein [Austropuccinia psidii MF-1]